MNTQKVGILNIPKNAFKSITQNRDILLAHNGKEVQYVINMFKVDVPMATIDIDGTYFVVPSKYVKNPVEDMYKALKKKHTFTHKSGFSIIDTGLGIGVKTVKNPDAWACSMMGLNDFLAYTKTSPTEYTKDIKRTKNDT